MTTTERTAPPSPQPRTLQADLLADLREAAPTPIARPEVDDSASVAAKPSDATVPETPTLDVRVTPRRWSAPSLRRGGTGTALVLTAGPVRVSITAFDR